MRVGRPLHWRPKVKYVWLGLVAAAGVLAAAGSARAGVTVTPSGTTLPIVVPNAAPVAAVSVSLSAQDTDPPPVGAPCGYPSNSSTFTGPVWSWTVAVSSGPSGPMASVSPATGAAAVTATLSGMQGPGHWQVTVTATATYRHAPCPDVVTRSGQFAYDVYVVGVQSIQFSLPGGSGFLDMPPEGLYVAAGTTVAFKAIPTPVDAPWPGGKPVWGGTCGANGTGPTTSVALNTPSQSMSDTQTITAECGNTVSAPIVRYDVDSATLDITSDVDPANDTASSNSLFYTSTYKLWVPDQNLDGRPDAVGGNVVLKSIDLGNLQALTNPPQLTIEHTWPFMNGQQQTQQEFAASVPVYDQYHGPSVAWGGPAGRPGGGLAGREGVRRLPRGRVACAARQPAQPPPPPADPLAAFLTKAIPQAAIADKVLKELRASLVKSPITLGAPNGVNDRVVNTKKITLKTTIAASQLGQADVQKIIKLAGVHAVMEASVTAEVNESQVVDNAAGVTYYATLFATISDRVPGLRKKTGPLYPAAANPAPSLKIELAGGPTGLTRERPALTRSGYVYAAVNYVTADDPAKRKVFGAYAITTNVDPFDGKPNAYDIQAAYQTTHQSILNTSVNEFKDRGYSVTSAALPNGPVISFAAIPTVAQGFDKDFIYQAVSIPWGF